MRWTLFVLSILPLAAQQRPGAGPNLYSKQKEAALGAELAKQVEQASTSLNNPDALQYVQQMGARLAAQLLDPPFPYTFALISSTGANPMQEPLALPGGYIYVPSSVFLNARDESEFAGVLAHAMAHVADRDGTRTATRGQIAQMANVPLVFYGGAGPLGLHEPSSVAIPVAFLQLSTNYELQADALAVKMTSGAGYDGEGLLRYLGHEQPQNFMTQATLNRRIAALRTTRVQPPDSGSEFLQLQHQIRNPQ